VGQKRRVSASFSVKRTPCLPQTGAARRPDLNPEGRNPATDKGFGIHSPSFSCNRDNFLATEALGVGFNHEKQVTESRESALLSGLFDNAVL
jgi:hypothetical protein